MTSAWASAGSDAGRYRMLHAPNVGGRGKPSNLDRPILDFLDLRDLVEIRDERIVLQHANHERGLGTGKCLGGPLDVPAKLVQIGRLDPVLAAGRRLVVLLGRQRRRANVPRDKQKQPDGPRREASRAARRCAQSAASAGMRSRGG